MSYLLEPNRLLLAAFARRERDPDWREVVKELNRGSGEMWHARKIEEKRG